jgi:predicted P-loop ATPase/GTPase
MDCKKHSLEFVLPIEIPALQNEPKYTFGLLVKKQNPTHDAKTYKIETITDLYRLVTPENLERLTKDVSEILRLYAYQKQAIGDSDIEASFEWIDD